MNRYVYPDPKDSRSWTKQHWKKMDRASRLMNKIVAPKVEEELEKGFRNLIVYGTAHPEMFK